MKITKNSQSVLDTFLSILPSIPKKDDKTIAGVDYVDPESAKLLFSVWHNGKTRNRSNLYERPITLSLYDVQKIQKAGLVKSVGNELEITDKGSKIISIMVLGDDRSSFDDNKIEIDYNQALSNVKNVKTAKQTKVADFWWDRFLPEKNNI